MFTIKRILGILVGVVMVLTGFAATAHASADIKTSDEQWATTNVSTVATAATEATTSVSQSTLVELRFNNPNGVTVSAKAAKKAKAYTAYAKAVKKAMKLPASKRQFWLKKGAWFQNSGVSRSGGTRYWEEKVGTGYSKGSKILIVWVGKNTCPSGWAKAHCKNCVKNTTKKGKKFAPGVLQSVQVSLVQKFKTEWSVQLSTTLSGRLSGQASVDCGSAKAGSSFSIEGSAKLEESTTIKVEASSEVEAKAKAKGEFSLSAKQTSDLEVSAAQNARLNLTLQGQASAWCKSEATPTPTPPPPPVPAPNLIETDTINDVVVSNTRTITVSGTVAKDHTATLFASAKNGGSITANKSQTVSGSFTKTVTYTAPDEVPASGTDWVEFTLTQDDNQVDTASTNKFVITARPTTPK